MLAPRRGKSHAPLGTSMRVACFAKGHSLLALAALAALLSCTPSCTQSESASVLQASDLSTAGGKFNAGEIVTLPSFTDATGIAEADVQSFLEATPYGSASFLATYSSNGNRADDAIMAAAARYTLNPLVFLVAAEEAGGLIGLATYPASPARVEYAFNCGCAQGGTSCDPLQAGFDLQVDCLGNALRQSLDAVATTGQTAGGWGPGKASLTLDGVRVTPADASTAAIYQYIPTVALTQAGGTWLFWNLWTKYAAALKYAGGGNVATATASIGDACTATGNCGFQGGVCATNYPGGLCTAACTGECPSDSSGAAAFCASFPSQGGYCLPICNPSASACRTGYTCEKVAQFGNAANGQYVCSP
jgi:hypothetical protein